MRTHWVVVTGCDSGFGARLVERLVAETKLSVIACHHRTDSVDRPSPGERVKRVHLDITDCMSVADLSLATRAILESTNGTLVGLVNNAGGLLVSGPVEWSTAEQDSAQMDLNFAGTVRVTKALLPFVRLAKGRVVIVSSVLGIVAAPFGAAYAASKFALEGWSDALRREMIPFGVRVILVQPGMFTSTKFYQGYTDPVADNWKKLDTDIQSAYGPCYRDYAMKRMELLRDYFGDPNIDRPVSAMIHALQSSFPKSRYRVGYDCRIFARVLQCLPTCLADLAMTVSDTIVLRDRSMYPVMPVSGLADGVWGMITFSITSYDLWCHLMLCVLALGIISSIFLVMGG